MTEIETFSRIYLECLVWSRKHPEAREAAATLEEINRIIDANGSRAEVKALTLQVAQQIASK